MRQENCRRPQVLEAWRMDGTLGWWEEKKGFEVGRLR